MAVLIRPARLDDATRIQAVEIAAAERFAAIGMEDIAALTRRDPFPVDIARELIAAASLFVAETDGRLAGFVAAWPMDGYGFIGELDVHPDFAGRKIGARLIERAVDWAGGRRLPALTLATFRDVPWNAPYYARLGFSEYPVEAWGPRHHRNWRRQGESGLDMDRRVLMIRTLAHDPVLGLVRSLWERMQAREWAGVRALLQDDFTCVWPLTREVIESAEAFVSLNRDYPGQWTITVENLWPMGDGRAVSMVRVEIDGRVDRAMSVFEEQAGKLTAAHEIWGTAALPPYDRSALARRF